ncbi:MAG TPA: ROK family protein, partial [Chloroflexota bacterium]|nr:ROK family protein [Chloroflexota bacterium]
MPERSSRIARSTDIYVVGVDLGGTRLRVALADRTGEIVRQRAVPTRASQGQAAVIDRLASEVRAVLEPLPKSCLTGVAVAVPGPVDPGAGVVYRPPNLAGWGDVPLKSILEADLEVPVHLGNDANVAALAEHQFGVGRGQSHLVYLTVSTGIGGGVVDANRPILGAWGGAAELGHMTIDLNGPRCGCGNHGCLEAMASGTAIAREAQRRIAAGQSSILADDFADNLEGIRADPVVSAAENGDQWSLSVVEWADYNLGVGLANVMHLYDPSIIAIGGGVANAWTLLEPPMKKAIRDRAIKAYVQHTKVARSQLGD